MGVGTGGVEDVEDEGGRVEGDDWERIWSFLGARLGGMGVEDKGGIGDGVEEGIVAARAPAKRRAVAVDHCS